MIAQDARWSSVDRPSVLGAGLAPVGAGGCTPATSQGNSAPATDPEACPLSTRLDGLHSWRFDGDDPYIVCVFCDEMRDTITGRVVRPGKGAA